jgi:hypothetical protein
MLIRLENPRRLGTVVVTHALWTYLIFLCSPYVHAFCCLHFEKSSVSCWQISSKWPGFIRYWSRCWTFCGWIDIWVLPHHCCYILSLLKKLWDVCGNFRLMRIAHTPVYNIHSHRVPLWVHVQPGFKLWGNKIPLCGQHLSTAPFIVFPVIEAVIFLPPNMEPTHH